MKSKQKRVINKKGAISNSLTRIVNKKGTVFDLLTLSIFVLVLAISIFIYWQVFEAWNVQQSTSLSSEDAHTITAEGRTAFLVWDYIFPFLILGGGVGVAWLAFRIKSHPALFFASLLVLVFLIIIFGVVSDVFTTFSEDSTMANSTATYPIIVRMMQDLPSTFIILAFITMIALYAFGGSKD